MSIRFVRVFDLIGPRRIGELMQQLENARAALDLYRSVQHPWENAIDSGSWPCMLPPVGYAEYFL